jgi:hypothetical protein
VSTHLNSRTPSIDGCFYHTIGFIKRGYSVTVHLQFPAKSLFKKLHEANARAAGRGRTALLPHPVVLRKRELLVVATGRADAPLDAGKVDAPESAGARARRPARVVEQQVCDGQRELRRPAAPRRAGEGGVVKGRRACRDPGGGARPRHVEPLAPEDAAAVLVSAVAVRAVQAEVPCRAARVHLRRAAMSAREQEDAGVAEERRCSLHGMQASHEHACSPASCRQGWWQVGPQTPCSSSRSPQRRQILQSRCRGR